MTWLSDTIVLRSSRSCAILVQSATDDPIQSLMSSVHRLLGQPRRFLPLEPVVKVTGLEHLVIYLFIYYIHSFIFSFFLYFFLAFFLSLI